METDKTKPSALQEYDVIIYGGGLYAGGVSGISLLTKNFDTIKNKALYLFTVGVADVNNQQITDHIRGGLSSVLTLEMQKAIKIFHMRGGMDYLGMSLMHRIMMGIMLKMLRKKSPSELTSDDKLMIETYGKKIDFSEQSMIIPLTAEVKASI